MNYDQINALLANPPEEARGMTRWWWYGCCVDKKEIARELDFMKEAGLGGVELQILYPLTPDDREKGLRNIPYGSPEFYDILNYTAIACKERGMVCDYTPGSSWPYGGPTVEDADAQQEAIPYQLDVHGPKRFSCDFTTRFAGTVCAAVMGRMENSVMLPETVMDITDNFRIKPLFGWPWGTELVAIDIPEGDWKICFFVISQHRNHVGKPSRNAGGLVIDHCSRRATENFLNQMVQPVLTNAPNIRGIFCDSIEVEGHNWSGVLLEEFRCRRGYDLKPYIYALWGDMGEITPHIRYDYFKTMSELTIENFFDPLTAFAHKNGMHSRIQAHGTWGDILRVYGAADFPEGETFGDHRTLSVNTIHRRLAASAGHIYGKNIISNETFTWLKRPRFTETLEELKAAVDAVFLDGMNMIVNHGYAYSPEVAGKRGWPFYASTHINHTTPWWPLYGNLGNYIHRASAILRWGYPVAEVAVYLPQADVYADNMLSELHLAMRLEEHLEAEAMDGIQKAGYWFDYINDEALCTLGQIGDGKLTVGENCYRAIVLVGCSRLPVETAERLRDFAQSGGILLCDGVPSKSCGLLRWQENEQTVQKLMTEAKPVVVKNRYLALQSVLRQHLVPDVTLSAPETVGYIHRTDGKTHLFFLSNLSETKETVVACFKDRTEPVRAWSVNTTAPVWIERQGEECTFTMNAHESVLIAFSPDLVDAPVCPQPETKTRALVLTGWTLTVGEIVYPMEVPISWESISGLEHYSGTGCYRCDFTATPEMQDAKISLHGLSAAARVWLNDEWVGDIWTHPLSISLGKHLKPGENHLRIEVYSTLINEMMTDGGYEKCPEVLPEWPYYGAVINNLRKTKLTCHREYTEQKEVLQSGLWGGTVLFW